MSRETAFKVIALSVVTIILLTACASAPTQSQPTTAPAEPTTAPAEPTTAPAEPTTAPAEPTTAPVEPTKVPEPVSFVFAHSGPIRTMDAPVTWYGSTHWLTNLLYDCLIWRKGDGSGYVGQAAEKLGEC